MARDAAVYRPLPAGLRPAPRPAFVLAAAGIRTAARHRIPLVAIYLLPGLWATVMSFNIYAKFALEEGTITGVTPGVEVTIAMRLAARLIDVRTQIAEFFNVSRLFALAAMAWYGAGLIAEDRRHGAHALLFARPITRAQYVFGRLLTILFFGAMATVAPGLVILLTAAFSSPDWSFVTGDPRAIAGSLAFALLTTLVFSLVVLAASSLATRRTFALAAAFGVVLIPHALGMALQRLQRDAGFRVISPLSNLGRAGHALIGVESPWYRWPASWSFAALAGLVTLCIAVIVLRARRLDAVP